METTIEKLTEDQRERLAYQTPESTKALRIIDQLTAALEEAEKRAATQTVLAASRGASLARSVDRAEALQARVAELEAQDARTAELLAAEHATSIRCQSELADLRGRVEALATESLDARHGAGGRGIYAAELRSLIRGR